MHLANCSVLITTVTYTNTLKKKDLIIYLCCNKFTRNLLNQFLKSFYLYEATISPHNTGYFLPD